MRDVCIVKRLRGQEQYFQDRECDCYKEDLEIWAREG